ncbi:MAG TPA: hypothetical protein VF212_09625 [Longimicrobiales bacterium]
MTAWAGLALALRSPEEDAMRSRVPTYIHPLAGRALAWHALRTLAALDPPPRRLFLISASPLDPSVVRDLPAEIVETTPDGWWADICDRLDADIERLLVVDAAAATLGPALRALVPASDDRAVVGAAGPLAAWLGRARLDDLARGGATLDTLAGDLDAAAPGADEDCLVRDRAALARAGATLRDRIVLELMAGGTTFVLPETVHVDVDVRIGPDTVVYPGVVLEGSTTIGAETVIGPGCRIIDSWIGSGVELKGWNYIIGANIRNRAVLEPYVRRGFD